MAPHYRDKENDELIFIILSALVIWLLVFLYIAVGASHS